MSEHNCGWDMSALQSHPKCVYVYLQLMLATFVVLEWKVNSAIV